MRLTRLAELRVDESALTGESAPVTKDAVVLPKATPVADRRNVVYSGTLVTAGTGAGVIVATGAETELGEIHRLVGAAEALATPLTQKLTWFSKVLTVAILALAAVTFGIGLAAARARPKHSPRRPPSRSGRSPRACPPWSPSPWPSAWHAWRADGR